VVQPKHSLGARITWIFLGLLAILLVLLGVFQYATLRSTLIQERIASMQSDIQAAFTVTSKSMQTNLRKTPANSCGSLTPVQMQNFAQAISNFSGSNRVAVVVYNCEGKQVAQTTSPNVGSVPGGDSAEINAALAGGGSSNDVVGTPSGQVLTAIFPVPIGAAKPVIAVELATSMAPINQSILKQEIYLAGSGLAVLALGLLFGTVFTGRALRPLRTVTQTAERFGRGDLSARSNLPIRHDEVGVLAVTFDQMASTIQADFSRQQESEQRVRRFIADASHELRTPVTALKGYVDVLRRGAGRDPQALDSSLEAMAREAERMRVLVVDLLTLARLDVSHEVRTEKLDLSDLLGRILSEGVPGMPKDLVRDFPVQPVFVQADGQSLDAVARNLLVNSCKYAPGAKQTWTVFVQDGMPGFIVADEGPGIPAGDLPHIFERFYRGEKTRNREEGGTGLGLAIVQGMVEAMGGRVEVASVEGKGTTFRVWLKGA
jgi:two-component system OmpR family sensor kinase